MYTKIWYTSSIYKRKEENKILVIGSDHGGYKLKEEIKKYFANKFKGVRCAPCYNETTAKFAKMHNNANVLSLGADYVSVNDAICIIRMFLATPFEGGRHEERVKLISDIENENMK